MSPQDTRWAFGASLKMAASPGFPGPWMTSALFPTQSVSSIPEEKGDGLCSPGLSVPVP